MNNQQIEIWLSELLPKYNILTNAVVNIIQSLLGANSIDYLAVSGRTKDPDSIKEKIKRKSYAHPEKQMTDLSGIRIIVYFESDVAKVSKIIERSFSVDFENSLSKDEMLATDQIGYRSIHYVCDLGNERIALPEFSSFGGMKFEFQIRTVLQHAWAELAHDRNYKFSGKLPKNIERKLYLYSGMLEIADNGFDELAKDIDIYIEKYRKRVSEGDYEIEINSLSLEEFVDEWASRNSFPLQDFHHKLDVSELVTELNEFGINKVSDLRDIIPDDYVEKANNGCYSTNIFGLLRDWMLITDYKRYYQDVSYDWRGFSPYTDEIFPDFFDEHELNEIYSLFGDHDPEDWDDANG